MMQQFETLFFYTLSSSVLLMYGIGLEKTFFESHSFSAFINRLPIIFLNSLLSITTLWFLVTRILLPMSMGYLIPMAILFMSSIIYIFLQIIISTVSKPPASEQLFILGILFLALFEGISFIDSLLIVFSGILTLGLTMVILFSIRSRIADANVNLDWKGSPLILISMGLLCMVLYAADISWFFTEVLG